MSDRIVAVGFLTSHDLKVLGTGFTRHFAVPQNEAFGELLEQLNQIDVDQLNNSIVLRPTMSGGSGR